MNDTNSEYKPQTTNTHQFSRSAEAKEIRSKLQLIWNERNNCYEIYTTVKGSGIWKWFKITDEDAIWWSQHFGLAMPSKTTVIAAA